MEKSTSNTPSAVLSEVEARRSLRQRRMMRYFITATEELIRADGIKDLTIRKIATRAGYSSATLYNYFEDLDELILFASFKFRREYLISLSREIRPEMSSLEQYTRIYELFCHYTFRAPDIYMNLFFGRHSYKIKSVLESYYAVFPEEFVPQTELVRELLLQGNIFDCDRVATRYLAKEGFIKEENREMVVRLMVRVHESYMYELIINPNIDPDEQTTRFMNVFHHVIRTN